MERIRINPFDPSIPREEAIGQLMQYLGLERSVAEQLYAIETGEIPPSGDIAPVLDREDPTIASAEDPYRDLEEDSPPGSVA